MIYFTSDTHFSHRNILSYCGRTEFMTESEREDYERTPGQKIRMSFDSIRRMNNRLIDDINARVGRDDILIHLGDFCFGGRQDMEEIRDRINCHNLYLILGNHDKNVLVNLEPVRQWDRSLFCVPPIGTVPGVFNAVFSATEVWAFNQSIFLSHYAHAVWNKSHHKAWHLYGHSHSTFESFRESHFPGRPMIDVGVDNRKKLHGDWGPFSFLELKARFVSSAKKYVPVDHHGE